MNVTVELKNFYPSFVSDPEIKGSLHISIEIESIKFDLRDLFVHRKDEDKYYIRLPLAKGRDHETGEFIMFPTLSFENKELFHEIIGQIQKAAPDFIGEYMKTYKKPARLKNLGIDTGTTKAVKNNGGIPRVSRPIEKPTQPKEMAVSQKAKPSMPEYFTPPKRKTCNSKR